MAEESINLLDMEAEMEKDAGGVYRKQLMETLAGIMGNVRSAMDAGLAPDEFEKADRFKAAVEACETVVDGVWKNLHG